MNTQGMYTLELTAIGYTVKTFDGCVVDSFDTKTEALDLIKALTH